MLALPSQLTYSLERMRGSVNFQPVQWIDDLWVLLNTIFSSIAIHLVDPVFTFTQPYRPPGRNTHSQAWTPGPLLPLLSPDLWPFDAKAPSTVYTSQSLSLTSGLTFTKNLFLCAIASQWPKLWIGSNKTCGLVLFIYSENLVTISYNQCNHPYICNIQEWSNLRS